MYYPSTKSAELPRRFRLKDWFHKATRLMAAACCKWQVVLDDGTSLLSEAY